MLNGKARLAGLEYEYDREDRSVTVRAEFVCAPDEYQDVIAHLQDDRDPARERHALKRLVEADPTWALAVLGADAPAEVVEAAAPLAAPRGVSAEEWTRDRVRAPREGECMACWARTETGRNDRFVHTCGLVETR